MDGGSWASLAAFRMKAKGRVPAAGFLCCLLLLLAGLSVHCERSGTKSISSASGDNDDTVTVTVVLPEWESPAFAGPEVWRPVGALRKAHHRSRNASRSFASRLIRLHVSGSTPTRELLLQLLSLHTTSDLLLQQQQQQHQRHQINVAYLLKSLEEDTAFRDIKQRMQQEVLQLQECGLCRGNSSSCRCKRKRRRLVALGASLLHAAPFLQHRAVFLVYRFRLAPVDLAAAQNGTEQETDTEKETEKKCRLDPLADGCTARDYVNFPLQLSLKMQKPAPNCGVFKESLTEWQNRVALDLLASFKFEDRKLVDLTKPAINVRVYLQTMLNMTEVFSVPPDWKLSNFLQHFAFVAVSSAAPFIAYPEGVGSAEAAVTDVQNGLGAFSLKGEKLQADITMAEAAKAGILLKALPSSRIENVLLAMSQTRIFCFYCLGGPAESRGKRFVVASLLIDVCEEGEEEQSPTLAPRCRLIEGAETTQLNEPHNDQSKYPNCKMGSFVVSGAPVETSALSLRHFLLSSAGLSSAAGAAFYLCVGLSPVSCTPLDWEVGRQAKGLEQDPQEAGGLISKLLLAAAEKQHIYLLKRPLAPLPLSALSRAVNKFFPFSVAPLPYHLEGQHMPCLVTVNVQLNPLGAGLSDSAKSARGVVFVAGVSEDLLQEEFLCHLALQRIHIPSLQPWKHLRLCILPRAAAAGGGGTAAAATAEKVEGCLSGPLGSSMGEVIKMMEKTDGELYVLPRETKGPKETQEMSACNDNPSACSVVIFPQELSLKDCVFSLVIGLPSGGVFAVANIPVSVTAGEVLFVIRSAVAASSETLIKFPTALTATSLILVSRDTDKAVPQDMQAWKLRGFREKETEGDTSKPQAEDSQRQLSLVSSVMLQFKFRPLDAARFQLRMQPLKDRVLDFPSRVFSPKGAKPNKAK